MSAEPTLPGLNCGVCGSRTCADFALRLGGDPALIARCIYLAEETSPDRGAATGTGATTRPGTAPSPLAVTEASCPSCRVLPTLGASGDWVDSLGREFDFYLEHFPEDPGPREIVIPHNPMLTREMEIAPGDIMIGRPLGMSCGCPITHCGVVRDVDRRTGVIVWCITGPLGPREQGYKDIGYYIAEAYEGLVRRSRGELQIGRRHYFQPRMCMLQWRHSGLVNYLNRVDDGWQVRLEGLWIG